MGCFNNSWGLVYYSVKLEALGLQLCWDWTLSQEFFENFGKIIRFCSYLRSGTAFFSEPLGWLLLYISLRIQFKCGKIRTRITPNTDTFYAVRLNHLQNAISKYLLNIFIYVREFSNTYDFCLKLLGFSNLHGKNTFLININFF